MLGIIFIFNTTALDGRNKRKKVVKFVFYDLFVSLHCCGVRGYLRRRLRGWKK